MLSCEATGVLGPEIRIHVNVPKDCNHAQHNKTAVPEIGYEIIDSQQYEKGNPIQNPNDELPVCKMNAQGKIVDHKNITWKKSKKDNPNSKTYYHYCSKKKKNLHGTLQTNSKGEYVMVTGEATEINVEVLDTVSDYQ